MSGNTIFNLKGIREAIMTQLDWAPKQSSRGIASIDQFINRAMYTLALEAPYLFFVDIQTWSVPKQVAPTDATDVLNPTTDAWVVETALSQDSSLATTFTADQLLGMGGRQLEMYDATSTRWFYYTIREAWNDGGADGGKIKFSLDRPWQGSTVTTTSIDWRIDTHEIPLPPNLIQVKSMTLVRDTLEYPLTILSEETAEHNSLHASGRLLTTGLPRWAFRRGHKRLQAPAFTPVGSIDATGTWDGTELAGTFQYCFTYVWGKREEWRSHGGPESQGILTAVTDRYTPSYESPPSEPTAVMAPGTDVVDVTLPNIDHMLGFNGAATERYRRTGIRKRIYRRRVTATAGTLETHEGFYLIDEVDGHETTWTDDGTLTPDYGAMLHANHGNQTVRLWPVPSVDYTMQIRGVVRPRPLVAPSDVPEIHEAAINILITLAAMYAYEAAGNTSLRRTMKDEYERHLYTLAKRFSDLRPAARPRRRRIATVRRKAYSATQQFPTSSS